MCQQPVIERACLAPLEPHHSDVERLDAHLALIELARGYGVPVTLEESQRAREEDGSRGS
jgi:hypothetical protein